MPIKHRLTKTGILQTKTIFNELGATRPQIGANSINGLLDEVTFNDPNNTFYKKNQFTNSDIVDATGLAGTSGLSLTNNAGVAPNGTNTATSVTINTSANSFHYAIWNYYLSTIYQPVVISVYMKYVSQQYAQMIFDDGGGNGIVGNFDLINGTSTTAQNTNGVTRFAKMQKFGNGWWRCSFGGSVGASSARFSINAIQSLSGAGWYTNYVGSNGSQFLVWGEQLEINTSGFGTIYNSTTARQNLPMRMDNSSIYVGKQFDEVSVIT